MRPTFLFDIGDVIWFYRPLSAVLHQRWADLCHLSLEEFNQLYHDYYTQFEDNSSTLNDFVTLHGFPDPSQFYSCLDQVFQPQEFNRFLNLPILALISDLRRLGRVGFLSNAENFFYPYIQQHLVPFFDFGYTSWELGVRKPNPQIYQQVLSRQNLSPSQVIFIDDTQKNVDSAQNLGIKSIKFDNNQQLINSLSSLSLSNKI